MNELAQEMLRNWAQIEGDLANFDGQALAGAILGAWLVSSSKGKAWVTIRTRRKLSLQQRLLTLLLSAGVGYLFMPLLLSLVPFVSTGVAAFVAAVVVIPISVKVMLWLENADLKEIVQRWRRGS
ncbi:hypothetical protein M2396_001727 [Pseudomonas sp. BIGb0278]|jgi:hypothetical protein|uniref:Uncharacterized protein n=1 Tax=Pseudomonas fluorescens TaxID=294 RepID=A0A5E6T1Q2_PSEFL|nr:MULTISPECIES: hypothetical protein [Pseudomonas]MCS4283462.1 hypothetical protein [Pseudomonas sp. BIGb0278]VVM86502.1 hypothetical protein PS623_02542 [Pseudomonas fluorescens]VVN21989.1 hypothetical protein PS631_04429 [Pseudomonas fluorescens]